jgi:hypothetical protein
MHISRSWGRLYFANSSTNNQGFEYTIVDTYGGTPQPHSNEWGSISKSKQCQFSVYITTHKFNDVKTLAPL